MRAGAPLRWVVARRPAGSLAAALVGALALVACSRMDPYEAQRELENRGWAIAPGGLVTAASQGSEDIVKLFLAAGTNPDEPAGGGVTALMAAARRGDERLVRLLLKHHATPDAQDFRRRTALMYAVDERHGKVARVLLEHGADPNLRDEEARTALGYAQRRNQAELVAALESRGAIR